MELNPDGTLPYDRAIADYSGTFTIETPMTQAEIVEEILYTLRAYAKKKKWHQWDERKYLIAHALDYVRRFDEITESLKTNPAPTVAG